MSTTSTVQASDQGQDTAHRDFVGPPEFYDLASAGQFSLLTALGLRQDHYFLDIGCGSLRAGRLFIPYLSAGRYFGIEPEQWLVDKGIESEIGRDLANIKKPTFSNDTNFTLTTFGRKFDFMVAQSIFSHATQAQIRRCFSQAKKALEPTGIFAATYFIGDTNYEGTEWVYPGRVHFTEAHFAKMAADEGLACKKLTWSQPNGQTWVAITHQDFAASAPDVADATRISVLEHELAAIKQKMAGLQQLHGLKLLKKVNKLFGR